MCGVASVWGAPEPDLVDRMLARLAHRGPDAAGKLETEHGTLGHRRLAIMDPAGGDQPIRADNGRAIVGNGEIYNFPEIRRSLRGRYCFNTGATPRRLSIFTTWTESSFLTTSMECSLS